MKELGIFILISNFTKGEWFVLFTSWKILDDVKSKK